MLTKLRNRLTFANVMSVIALFVALGGTSAAAVSLKKNSVRSKHIRNGQVKAPDLRANAVDSSKVADGTLAAQDFAPGQLGTGPAGGDLAGNYPNPAIANGAVDRSKIADNAVGGGELLNFVRREATATVGGGTQGNNIWNHNSASVSCNAGEQLIAGNAAWDNATGGDPMAIVEINPNYATNSVAVRGATDVATDRTLRAIAICL